MINIEEVFIHTKDISRYISACLFSLGKSSDVKIVARGNNIKKAVDTLAILIREYLEDSSYTILIGSEPFENRNVSTIEISLKGTKKENKE